MTTTKEHGRFVLGGIIPARLDLLEEALKELTTDHFVDSIQGKLFQFLDFYFQKTGGVLTSGALSDLLNRSTADPGRRALYEETYEDFKLLHVDDSDFIWSVHELKEDFAEAQVKTVLTDTMEILQKGLEQPGGVLLQGQADAREFLDERLAEIGSVVEHQDSPHGNMRDERSIILNEYAYTKQAFEQGIRSGIQFGIPELDAKVGGIQPGDLALSAAYTNDGKTTLCVQLAWSAAVEQGKNVLFLSTETVNTVVRRRLTARHSRHPKFAEFGLPEGLNSKDLKAGTLNPHEEEFLTTVVDDFSDRGQAYGELYIYQVPRNSRIEDIERIMYDVQKKFHIDLVVCDYLQLLQGTRARNTDRESLAGVIKGAKQTAVTFNKGNGVAFVSPWQVSRAAWESASSLGRYSSNGLAETAEATNTPDLIVSILAPEGNTDRTASLAAQVLKHRDGETADGIQLTVDYATCYFTGRGTLDTFSSAVSGGFGLGGGLDSLLN